MMIWLMLTFLLLFVFFFLLFLCRRHFGQVHLVSALKETVIEFINESSKSITQYEMNPDAVGAHCQHSVLFVPSCFFSFSSRFIK